MCFCQLSLQKKYVGKIKYNANVNVCIFCSGLEHCFEIPKFLAF